MSAVTLPNTSAPTPAGGGAPRRHPFIDHLCTLLDRILLGRGARRALEHPIPAGASLFVLPTWGWAHPLIDVGRKDRDRQGGRLLLPVRYTFYPSNVIVTSRPQVVHYVGVGLGHGMAGSMLLDPSADPGQGPADGRLSLPGTWGPASHAGSVASRLNELDQDGQLAYWEALGVLEENLEHALKRASCAARDGVVGKPPAAVDDITLERIRTEMVYGTDHGVSPIQRLVERCTRPGTFARVDPEKYVVTSVRTDARAAVRKALGDPHVGSKVRHLAIEMPEADLDELVAAYRQRYPSDRLSTSRARAALTVAPNANAVTVPLHEALVAQAPHPTRGFAATAPVWGGGL